MLPQGLEGSTWKWQWINILEAAQAHFYSCIFIFCILHVISKYIRLMKTKIVDTKNKTSKNLLITGKDILRN